MGEPNPRCRNPPQALGEDSPVRTCASLLSLSSFSISLSTVIWYVGSSWSRFRFSPQGAPQDTKARETVMRTSPGSRATCWRPWTLSSSPSSPWVPWASSWAPSAGSCCTVPAGTTGCRKETYLPWRTITSNLWMAWSWKKTNWIHRVLTRRHEGRQRWPGEQESGAEDRAWAGDRLIFHCSGWEVR